jgi:hypothetical protein
MSQVKIFQLNDWDWWAGYDLESVKAAYLKELGFTDPWDIENAFDDPHELSDEELDRLKFVDGDDPINEDGTPGGTRTFREQLNRIIAERDASLDAAYFPCFFASTEY